ncbi:hypothetical protein B0H11DRAFT_2007134 [Mycena galericulata]|nr:hypothetical protein B0H11DRAFT_2007134 [Mycena galericulata]
MYPRLYQRVSPQMSSQYTPSATVLQSVLDSRRARKTLHTGEDVWPVYLEAALLEGLEKYIPDDSRETRILGRFRGRNLFISEYIHAKTGVYRSNKQVGSRLQQLRHCSSDPKLRRLLAPFRRPSCSARHSSSGNWESMSNDSPPPEPAPLHAEAPIYIPILQLESISPTVTLFAPTPTIAQSSFAVWYEGQIVHRETTPLIVLMDEPSNGMAGYLHSTTLVPAYWSTIVHSPDPSKFVIVQEVVKDKEWSVAFSAEYRFVY